MNFNTLLKGAGNDLKIAIDDFIDVIIYHNDEIKKLKLENEKSSSAESKK